MLYTLILLQLPPGTQNRDDNSPLNLSNPFDVVVYIVLPIFVIVCNILWRRMKKRDKK